MDEHRLSHYKNELGFKQRNQNNNSINFAMGAWGTGIFEDDTALDFMADVAESDQPKELIRQAFDMALESDYLETDDGNAVTVAAAFVDRQLNGTRFSPQDGGDPLYVDIFSESNPDVDLSDLRGIAVAALQRVLAEDSELKELWEESGEFEEWRMGIDGLIERLNR